MTKEVHVTTATVKKVMQQRLTRGTPVLIADSFGQAKLRGATMIVASKATVKCNKGGRCAGDWCIGAAVFLTTPSTAGEDKQMGWRRNTVKVCLTHLKTDQGALLLPPPDIGLPSPLLSRISNRGASEPLAAPNGNGSTTHVSWGDLADAHGSGNLDKLALLSRRLKSENEALYRKVVEAQDKLIESLTRG
jgi:hypothetical protein